MLTCSESRCIDSPDSCFAARLRDASLALPMHCRLCQCTRLDVEPHSDVTFETVGVNKVIKPVDSLEADR